jgi:hypothetical protein
MSDLEQKAFSSMNPFDAPFAEFWERISYEWAMAQKREEFYDHDPRGCDYCDDWYQCQDCGARLEAEEEQEAEEAYEFWENQI